MKKCYFLRIWKIFNGFVQNLHSMLEILWLICMVNLVWLHEVFLKIWANLYFWSALKYPSWCHIFLISSKTEKKLNKLHIQLMTTLEMIHVKFHWIPMDSFCRKLKCPPTTTVTFYRAATFVGANRICNY